LVVIGADSIVVHGDRILEKPESVQHAHAMLRSLSGTTHNVLTAVCILHHKDGALARVEFVESTKVVFADLSDAMIDAYVATGEPMDKAGGCSFRS
jgi:septum formation protein